MILTVLFVQVCTLMIYTWLRSRCTHWSGTELRYMCIPRTVMVTVTNWYYKETRAVKIPTLWWFWSGMAFQDAGLTTHRLCFTRKTDDNWAPSSEFVSSSIPSLQILTAHAQPFRGARDLAFCLKVPLDSLLLWASSGGSGETARMHRLAWTFAARICDKYQIRLTRSN